MLWHVFMNPEDLDSDQSSSNIMNAYFLSWFFNVVTIHIRMLRGQRLLLDGNPKGYEVAEHIVKKVEINPHMVSILKNEKYI